MMRIEHPGGFSSTLLAATALVFVAFDAREMAAGPHTTCWLRSIAAQAIRADEVGAITPAALSDDGRMLAFVSRDHGPSRRSRCLNVYALDRSTGLITSESVTRENTPLDGDTRSQSQRRRTGDRLRKHRVEPDLVGRSRGTGYIPSSHRAESSHWCPVDT